MASGNADKFVPGKILQETFQARAKYHLDRSLFIELAEARILDERVTSGSIRGFDYSTDEELLEWARAWHADLAKEYTFMVKKLWFKEATQIAAKEKAKSKRKPKWVLGSGVPRESGATSLDPASDLSRPPSLGNVLPGVVPKEIKPSRQKKNKAQSTRPQ